MTWRGWGGGVSEAIDVNLSIFRPENHPSPSRRQRHWWPPRGKGNSEAPARCQRLRPAVASARPACRPRCGHGPPSPGRAPGRWRPHSLWFCCCCFFTASRRHPRGSRHSPLPIPQGGTLFLVRSKQRLLRGGGVCFACLFVFTGRGAPFWLRNRTPLLVETTWEHHEYTMWP